MLQALLSLSLATMIYSLFLASCLIALTISYANAKGTSTWAQWRSVAQDTAQQKSLVSLLGLSSHSKRALLVAAAVLLIGPSAFIFAFVAYVVITIWDDLNHTPS